MVLPENIQTKNLTLRPFAAADAAAVFAYWSSDADWERFNASVPASFTKDDAQEFVDEMRARSRLNSPNWAVTREGRVVGIVSMTFADGHRTAVIGYGIHGDLRGRGLVLEAAGRVVREAFAAYPQLEKIQAHTDAENIGSTRVLEKLGFAKEELLRGSQFVKGRLVNNAVYGLSRQAGSDDGNVSR